MPKDQKEPQSYGSGPDWVSGKTGQEVNDQDSPEVAPPAAVEHAGGIHVPDDQESVAHPTTTTAGERASVIGLTSAEGGTKTDGYFRKRDYE